jgi:hypothetical protein
METSMAMILHDLDDQGIGRAAAQTILTTSLQECKWQFIMPRQGGIGNPLVDMDGDISNGLLYDTDCWHCRACVGLEPYRGNHYYPSTTLDQETVDWLDSQGMIGAFNQSINAWQVPAKVYNNPNGSDIARFFEWTLINRKGNNLPNFSIGPTQMWLAQSCVTPADHQPSWGCLDNFPDSWEKIFAYYMSPTVGAIGATIMDTQYANIGAYPFRDDGSFRGTSTAISFLGNYQVGRYQAPGAPDGVMANALYYFRYWGYPGEFAGSGYMPWDPNMSTAEKDVYSTYQQASDAGASAVNTVMLLADRFYRGEEIGGVSRGNQPDNPQTTPAQWTGYEFTSPRTGEPVRVIARRGKSHASEIARVRARHNA